MATSAHAEVHIGDWVLGIVAIIALWLGWRWLSGLTVGTATTSFTAPTPTGVYTYGPDGLVNWSAYPQSPLAPTPLPPTWALPGGGTLFGSGSDPLGETDSGAAQPYQTQPAEGSSSGARGGPAPAPGRNY